MPNSNTYSFAKNFLGKSSQLVHMELRELLRLSDVLVILSIRHSKGPVEV